MDCVITQKHHRTVMGARGSKVQEITKQFDVGIKFPEKPSESTSNYIQFASHCGYDIMSLRVLHVP